MPRVLDRFLAFLGDRGLLPQAPALRDRLAEIAAEIPAAAADRSLWGPAKTFAVAAEEAGVDIQNRHAMNAFTEAYNRQLDQPQTQAQQVSRAKIGRNQPCPCGSGKKYKRCCGR